ncbi:MAG: UDP-N-acetylmuramoyl-tripeptide--D-alanyl-D-alanine ligase [Bacteroidota bacterium]
MQTPAEELYSLYRSHPLITTDTRKPVKDSIFFCLKGANFNGNEFAEKAMADGAAYVVVDEKAYKKGSRYILVDDTLKALQDLARYHRSLLTIPVIAITGSNGKTTTKELSSAVLQKKYKTVSTQGNLNNHIGVPLTLLSVTDDTEIAVIEMGANHQGEIAQLCEIAQPGFGLITNIGKAHLEGFGSFEGVIKAKSELYQYLQRNSGTIFVNGNNALLIKLVGNSDFVTYGTSGNCNCIGRLKEDTDRVTVQWKSKLDAAPLDSKPWISSQLVGAHNFENILAAACIGNYFRVSEEDINAAIREYAPTNNRSQLVRSKKTNNTIIWDAYNANPTSMSAAIEHGGSDVLILGDMLELGHYSENEHKEIINKIKEKGYKQVFLIGENFSKAAKGSKYKSFKKTEEALEYFKTKKITDAKVLVKGSRGLKLEMLEKVL